MKKYAEEKHLEISGNVSNSTVANENIIITDSKIKKTNIGIKTTPKNAEGKKVRS